MVVSERRSVAPNTVMSARAFDDPSIPGDQVGDADLVRCRGIRSRMSNAIDAEQDDEVLDASLCEHVAIEPGQAGGTDRFANCVAVGCRIRLPMIPSFRTPRWFSSEPLPQSSREQIGHRWSASRVEPRRRYGVAERDNRGPLGPAATSMRVRNGQSVIVLTSGSSDAVKSPALET